MAKCICCGRSLVTERSIHLGIGPECIRKSKKAGIISKRGNTWKRRVERTVSFGRGEPFSIGNTTYTRVENVIPPLWNDGKHLCEELALLEWMEQHGQIIYDWELTHEMAVLLKSGKTLDEIIKETLDKNDIL